MAEEVVFCTNCLENIPEDELHFEAENKKKQIVILCRSCFYESHYISDEMKEHFMAHEEMKNG